MLEVTVGTGGMRVGHVSPVEGMLFFDGVRVFRFRVGEDISIL